MIYLVISNLITLLVICYVAKKCYASRSMQKTFLRLIDHVNIGYYKYRARDGAILAANDGFVKILEIDMKAKEIVGRSLSELLIYVDDEDRIREELRAKGVIRNYEYNFKTLRGKDKCVLHNAYIIKKSYYGEEVIEALIEDITEEKLSYQKMKESQERYERLFKSSGDMVIIYGLDNLIIEEINPITEVITGFSEEELTGQSFEKLFHPSKRKYLRECKEDLLFKGTTQVETIVVCKNGTYKEVILTLSVVELEEDKIVMAVIKDISAMAKEIEEQNLRKKELEDFWKASVEREERIKSLRIDVERVKQQLKLRKEKNGTE